MKKLIFSAIVLFASTSAWAIPLPRSISKVYSYSCRFNFIEGEGVTNDNFIHCLPGQHLGQLSADYEYYLYSTPNYSNFHQRGSTRYFNTPVCGVAMQRYSCGNAEPRLEYGLSERVEFPFNVLINLPYSPEMQGGVGYAAAVNADGTCPEGLLKVTAAIARPQSIYSPLPSTFKNEGGQLNSWIIRSEHRQLESYKIWRTPGVVPCDGFGRCQTPSGDTYVLSETPYIDSNQSACVVPPTAL